MNSSLGQRKWRCPDCQRISLIPEFEEDPVLCVRCTNAVQASDGQNPAELLNHHEIESAQSHTPADVAIEFPEVCTSPKTSNEGTWGCGGILLFVVIVAIGSRFLSQKKSGSALEKSIPQVTTTNAENSIRQDEKSKRTNLRFVTGDVVWIQHGTFVAQDWDTLKQLSKAAKEKDDIGATQLWLDGSAFIVDDGPAQARVLDRGVLASEIRITSGRHLGLSGWIYNEQVTVGSDPYIKLKQEARSAQVHRSQFGEKWPLTVEHGIITCLGNKAIIFQAPNGKVYALNGPAIQMGYEKMTPDQPIWRDSTKYGNVQTKVNIGVLIEVGRKLCP